jgi:hypothetical protein
MRPKPCPLMTQLRFESPVCPVYNCWSFTKRPGLPCRKCVTEFREYLREVPADAR